MNKIIVQLPVNRDYAGYLEIQNEAGRRLAGPFAVCGRADDETARSNKNPGRDPLLPFGDTPFGEYQMVKIMPSGKGTAYAAEEYGSAGIVLMRPRLGDAALADANGRFGFFIQGGARTRGGLLRPTVDGSLRLADGDQRKFISALRKLGDAGCFCLVVATAKLGAKVAVAKTSPGRSGKNTRASLVLASGVIASTVTGAIRQAWMRTMLHAAGTTVAAGAAFVAVDHAKAQTGGDYHPGGNTGAMDQLNAVEHQSQEAAHATTDEEAHDKASQGFDTSTSAAPPPVIAPPPEQPRPMTEETVPANNTPTETQPETTPAPDNNAEPMTETEPQASQTPEPANNMTPEPQPEATSAPENNTQPAVAKPESQPTTTETAPTESTPTAENTSTSPSSTTESTAPATEPQPALMVAPADNEVNTPSGPTETMPSVTAPAQEPASQAIVDHDAVNSQPIPQPGPTPEPAKPDTDFTVHSDNSTANNLPMTPPESGEIMPSKSAKEAADYATKNAEPHADGTYGVGECATYVTEALTSSGVNLDKSLGGYSQNGYAKNLGPVLTGAGFASVYSYEGSGSLEFKDFKPQKGDVVVIQSPTSSDQAGHTAIFNGKDWVSDFVQDDQRANPKDTSGGIYPGSNYRDNHPSFKIYRLPAKSSETSQ